MYIIELDKNIWAAEWDGDPGRTLVKKNAKIYSSRALAQKALNKIKKSNPRRSFQNSKIVKV